MNVKKIVLWPFCMHAIFVTQSISGNFIHSHIANVRNYVSRANSQPSQVQYPDPDYILNSMIHPMSKKLGINIDEVSFHENEDVPFSFCQGNDKNYLRLYMNPAKLGLSENQVRSALAHELTHIHKNHAKKRAKLSQAQKYINPLFQNILFPATFHVFLFTCLFKKTSTLLPKTAILSGLFYHTPGIYRNIVLQPTFKRLEKEADLEAVRLFPEYTIAEGLISEFKQEQQHLLESRTKDIADIMASNIPWWKKKFQVKNYTLNDINEYGDNLRDSTHPHLSTRIKDLQEEILKRDNPQEYNRQKQEHQDHDFRAHMTV